MASQRAAARRGTPPPPPHPSRFPLQTAEAALTLPPLRLNPSWFVWQLLLKAWIRSRLAISSGACCFLVLPRTNRGLKSVAVAQAEERAFRSPLILTALALARLDPLRRYSSRDLCQPATACWQATRPPRRRLCPEPPARARRRRAAGRARSIRSCCTPRRLDTCGCFRLFAASKVSAGLTSLMVLRQGGGCRQEESVEAGMGGRGEGDWPRRGALPGAPTSPAATLSSLLSPAA